MILTVYEYIKITKMTPLLHNFATHTELNPHLCAARTNGSSLNELACISHKLSYFNVNYCYTLRARTNRRVLEARSVHARYLKYHANDVAIK